MLNIDESIAKEKANAEKLRKLSKLDMMEE